MQVQFLPTLAILRDLYERPRDMARFRAYVHRLTGGTGDVVLPIGNANPMAKGHLLAFIDALEAVDAEAVAEAAALDAASRLPGVHLSLRVGLSPIDDVAGGWTDRHLTDAKRRFESGAEVKRGFATAHVWASEPPSAAAVREETLATVYRAAHVARHGEPRTLGDALRQEGRALVFAGARGPALDGPDLERARRVLARHLTSPVFGTWVAAFFGDAAAAKCGYPPLGLPPGAGFAVAAAEAARAGVGQEAAVDG